MNKIIYYIFYVFSLLPLWILYGVGDFAFLILYYIIGYRRKIVWTNLKNSFPGKSYSELKKVEKKFYRNFAHTWMETIKFISISEKQLGKMFSADYGLLYELFDTYPRATMLTGHFMNWEYYPICMPLNQPYPFIAVYMNITNPAINYMFLKIRSRFGSAMLRAGRMGAEMMPWRNKQYMIGLGADQSPVDVQNAGWINFLNQPTAFTMGPEKNARIAKGPVIMSWIEKRRTGRYTVHFELLFEHAELTSKYDIIKSYVKKLEYYIHKQPENYLWSHRRWKHQWKKEYEYLWIGEPSLHDSMV